MAFIANKLSEHNLILDDGSQYIITGENTKGKISLVISAKFAEAINKALTSFNLNVSKALIKNGYKPSIPIIEVPDPANTLEKFNFLRVNTNGSAMENQWSAVAYTENGGFVISAPALRELREHFKANEVVEDPTVGTYSVIHFVSDIPVAEKMNKGEVYVLTRTIEDYPAGLVFALNEQNEVGYYDTETGNVSIDGMDVVEVAALPKISNLDEFTADYYVDLDDTNKVYTFADNAFVASEMAFTQVSALPGEDNTDSFTADYYVNTAEANKVYTFEDPAFVEAAGITFSAVDELPGEINTGDFTKDYYINTAELNKVYTFSGTEFVASDKTFEAVAELPPLSNKDEYVSGTYYVDTTTANKVYEYSGSAFTESSMTYSAVAALPELSNVASFTKDYYINTAESNKVYTFEENAFAEASGITFQAVEALPEESNVDTFTVDYYVNTSEANKVYTFNSGSKAFEEAVGITMTEVEETPVKGNASNYSTETIYLLTTSSTVYKFTGTAFEVNDQISAVATPEGLPEEPVNGTIYMFNDEFHYYYDDTDHMIEVETFADVPVVTQDPSQNVIYKVTAGDDSGKYFMYDGNSVNQVTVNEVAGLPQVIAEDPSTNVIYKLNSASTYHKWNGASFDTVTAEEVNGLPEVIVDNPPQTVIYDVAGAYSKFNGTGFDSVTVVKLDSGLPELNDDPSTSIIFKLPAGTVIVRKSKKIPQGKYRVINAETINAMRSGVKFITCGTGICTCCVDSNGDIFPCINMVNDIYKIGNVKHENSLKELWSSSSTIKNLKKLNVDTMNEKCQTCMFRYFCGGYCRGETIANGQKITDPYIRCKEWQQALLTVLEILCESPDLYNIFDDVETGVLYRE